MIRALICAIVILASCGQQARTPAWSKLTPEDFSAPLEVVKGGARRALSDCAAVVEAVNEKFETANPADYAVLLATAGRCAAHEAIAHAKPYTASNWKEGDGVPATALPGVGWESRTALVAGGDFDGDGLEDRMFRIEQWASRGTNRRVRFVIVTKKQASAVAAIWRELGDQ